MNRIPLQVRTHNPYLGVKLQNDLKLTLHIDQVTSKANRCLGFLRRNMGKCPEKVKEQAYFAVVRPHLEYVQRHGIPTSKRIQTSWNQYKDEQRDSSEMTIRVKLVQLQQCKRTSTGIPSKNDANE